MIERWWTGPLSW